MPKYRIVVHGQNYLLDFDGEPKKLGFRQTFYIRAATVEQAREKALASVTRDPTLVQNILNGSRDPIRNEVESAKWAGLFKLFASGAGKRHFYLQEEGKEPSNDLSSES